MDEVAAAQDGLITYEQLRRFGLSKSAVYRRTELGALVRVHEGVFRVAGAPVTHRQQLRAALLVSGEGAAISHRAALQTWGLAVMRERPVEITVPRPESPQVSGAIVHRSKDLADEWIVLRSGLPVTTPPRTLCDVGAVLPDFLVERALDLAVSRRLVTVRGLKQARRHLSKQGRNGVGVIGRVLEERALGDDVPDGLLEPMMARLLRDHGLPAAEFQYRIDVDGETKRIDFVLAEFNLAMEVDGYEFHSTWEQFQLDRARDNELAIRGWTVLRFTWNDLVRKPRYVARIIRKAIRQAA